jgi:hypothetical protein
MPKYVKQDYFANPDKFYRVIRGDAAAQDIQKSGMVRSAAEAGTNYGPGAEAGKINLGNRPTAFPSFAKGSVDIGYAQAEPKHYIIETSEKLQASNQGRHGKGRTYFPSNDPATNQPRKSLPSSSIKLWEHVGDGKYQKVNTQQFPVDVKPASLLKGMSNLKLGLLSSVVDSAYGSTKQAYEEGKDVYTLGKGWNYSSGNSQKNQLKINESSKNIQKENPQYFSELQRLQEARQIPQVSVNSPAPSPTSRFNLPYQISNLLKFK